MTSKLTNSVVNAYHDLLSKVAPNIINEVELLKISEQLLGLDIDIRQLNALHSIEDKKKIIPVSPTCEVSIAELLQAKIDSSYKILAEKITSILKELANKEDKAALESMLNRINELTAASERMVKIFEKANATLLQEINGYASPQSYTSPDDFLDKVTNYARFCRKLSQRLELTCSAYPSSTTPNELKKEMAEKFFSKAKDKGYDLEQSSITIDGERFDCVKTFGAESKGHISKAKENATTLQKESRINQRSYFKDSVDGLKKFRQALETASNQPPVAVITGLKC